MGLTQPPAWHRLRAQLLLAGVVCVLTLVSWYRIDRPVAWWVHEQAPRWFRSFMSDLTDWGEATRWIVFLVGLCVICLLGILWQSSGRLQAMAWTAWLAARAWPRGLAWASLALSAVAAAGGLVNLAKVILGRHRPHHLFVYDHTGFEWFAVGYVYNSFPSGHSATVGALLGVALARWPQLWIAWSLLALLLMFSRVLVTAHFVSDVLAGGMVGLAVTAGFWWIWRDRGWLPQI